MAQNKLKKKVESLTKVVQALIKEVQHNASLAQGTLTAFQLYLVINKKIPVSKRYLIIGYLFYIFFLSSYDNFGRLIDITETGTVFTELMVLVQAFYLFSLSTILIYFIKKKYGMLLP